MGLKVKTIILNKADISESKWQEVKAERLAVDNVSLAHSTLNNLDMENMKFNDVNMGENQLSNVNLSYVGIQQANFSHAVIKHVHLFGTEFHHIVLPEKGDGIFNPDGQYESIKFYNCDLANSKLKNCNLANMELIDCDISGLKINGVLVEELMKNK